MAIVNPHDALFRKFLFHIEVAKDFLQIYLPHDIAEKCAWDTLSIESSSFVEPDLRQYYSDIVYRLRVGDNDSYISCIVEHQSTPYRLMALRLARYALSVMQQHVDQGNHTLPVVLPILFYHGKKSPYPYTTWFPDCFSDPKLAMKVYSRPFPLVDITVIPDEEILTHRNVAALEILQKHIRERDITIMVEKLAGLLNNWSLGDEMFEAAVCYTFECGNASSVPQLLDMLTQQVPHHQEKIMTIAQQLEQKGMEKGMEKGRQEGHKEGIFTVAKNMLNAGTDKELIKQVTGLTDSDLSRLTH